MFVKREKKIEMGEFLCLACGGELGSRCHACETRVMRSVMEMLPQLNARGSMRGRFGDWVKRVR